MERLGKSIYNGEYIVYDDGTVYSCKSKKNLKQSDNRHGYLTVSICISGKPRTRYVHRLIAEAFLENPNMLPEVNHKDENPGNNRLDNLEWCDSKYNKNYGRRAHKFSKSRGKAVICIETGIAYHGIREAMRQTCINASEICACCNGYRGTKQAGGYHWMYA